MEHHIACAKIIPHHENLDEDTTVNDAPLPVFIRHLRGEDPCKGFSSQYTSHIKFDIDSTYGVVEHIAFDDPDDLQGFLHTIHFESVVAFHWSTRSIRLGNSQHDVPLNEHLWHSNNFSYTPWKAQYLFRKVHLDC